MSNRARPLSPHLQVYRPQLTSVTSIAHRISGLFLCTAAVGVALALLALANGEAGYALARDWLGSTPGKILVLAWIAAWVYHFLNGIRHLVWDTGRALDLGAAERWGWVVILSTPVVTALIAWSIWS